ncbi:uncharacterized protein B0T23DRAFT_423580 [Neurospora hispaniola]|uniref:Uncharacterized protein n=1 Tax=Neurospora hispaniola TaxID=588809 RepID=A0AAJ0I052_9PEZI|nr:hypothetical protein B0T23DRAFT_423580 [Neurospora hispaniola]
MTMAGGRLILNSQHPRLGRFTHFSPADPFTPPLTPCIVVLSGQMGMFTIQKSFVHGLVVGRSLLRQKVKLVLVARLPVAGDDRLNVTNTATLTESQWSVVRCATPLEVRAPWVGNGSTDSLWHWLRWKDEAFDMANGAPEAPSGPLCAGYCVEAFVEQRLVPLSTPWSVMATLTSISEGR